MAIWVIKDGQREGPYEEQDVRELVYEGTYSDVDPAIRDGQTDWTTLGQMLGRVPAPVEPVAASASEGAAPASSGIPSDLPPPLPAGTAEPPPIPKSGAPLTPAFPPRIPRHRPVQVTVSDFDMPFGSMVVFLVKWALAAIPAMFILGAIATIFWLGFLALVAAVMGR